MEEHIFFMKNSMILRYWISKTYCGYSVILLISRSMGHQQGSRNKRFYERYDVEMRDVNKIFDFGVKVSDYPSLFYLNLAPTHPN